MISTILAAYDFSRFDRVVDVGGGRGELLLGILSEYPKLQGVLYDLPTVVAGVPAAGTGPVASRCEVVGGDFFKRVPEGADAYVLKQIIHSWNDEDASRILKNCRRAIKNDGTLLIMGDVLRQSSKPDDDARAFAWSRTNRGRIPRSPRACWLLPDASNSHTGPFNYRKQTRIM